MSIYFPKDFFSLLSSSINFFNDSVSCSVKKIYNEIVSGASLKSMIKRYDNIVIKGDKYYVDVNKIVLNNAYYINNYFKSSIKYFLNNVFFFHYIQKKKLGLSNWFLSKSYSFYGQLCNPIERVMIYVPGGSYCYISSMVMNIVPAIIAGVNKIYVSTPVSDDKIHFIAYVCKLIGINKIYRVGGAHCVFSFSLGYSGIPKVDKIFGPGNAFFSYAKKMIYGSTGVDLIAGPTELLIITDGTFSCRSVFLNTIAQLEHGFNSRVFIFSYNIVFLKSLLIFIRNNDCYYLNKNNIFLVYISNIYECIYYSNLIAPEHIELLLSFCFINKIYLFKNFGSIFLGCVTCEIFGDYCCGINHVLPTCSNGRFSSSLGVYSFVKFSNVLSIGFYNKDLFDNSIYIATLEGLSFHVNSLSNILFYY